jgi:hypothetical protein
MRTREIQTLSPSIGLQNTQDRLSKDTKNSLIEFNKRWISLLENPLAEYGNEALSVLNMKNTTKDEEISINLGQMLWLSNKKLWEIITNDRENKQIENMISPFWLHLNWVADDYNFKQTVNA